MTAMTTDAIWKTVVQRVSEHTANDPVELPPIYDAIDPEALDRLVRSGTAGAEAISIQFTYAGHRIEIESDGTVSCTPENRHPT